MADTMPDNSSFSQDGYEEMPPVYTMPEKFLPSHHEKQKRSGGGKGVIIALYTLIALVVIGGAAAVWYLFFYNQATPADETGLPQVTIPQTQQATSSATAEEPAASESLELKFVAKHATSGEEIAHVVIKLVGADTKKSDTIKVSSFLPEQLTGRATRAIGAIYAFAGSDETQRVTFSQPTAFVFSYVEPDNLTSKKENSLQLAEETSGGGWKYVNGATLDIVSNTLTVNWTELPAGRITILSNLEEEEPLQPITTSTPIVTPGDGLVATPLQSTTDADGDQLTDIEEQMYQSNPLLPDSDNDGYIDGSEVLNFYSPTGTSTLLAAGQVKQYNSEALGFSLLYPVNWTVSSAVGDNGGKVTFESSQDDFIQVAVEDNPDGLTIRNWYAQLVPGIDQMQLTETTIAGNTAIFSLDKANVYVAVGDKIYIFTYGAGLKTHVDYLTTFALLYRSFSLQTNGN